jgi:hypothetical protein
MFVAATFGVVEDEDEVAAEVDGDDDDDDPQPLITVNATTSARTSPEHCEPRGVTARD